MSTTVYSATANPSNPSQQTGTKDVAATSLVFSLAMRTVFFIAFGLLFVLLFALAGNEQPMKAAEKWWPYQALLANIATFLALRTLVRREGSTYRQLFDFRRNLVGKDLKQFAWLLVVGFVVGGAGLYGFSALILGSATPPELMFQPLPLWAAIAALILFPLSNGLVETPTYIGYAFPRLKARSGKLWLAIVLAGLPLAFQHVALPLVQDVPYMLWRFVAFIPLALALGFIFNRTKRLPPIALAHFVMDFQLAATVLIYSI